VSVLATNDEVLPSDRTGEVAASSPALPHFIECWAPSGVEPPVVYLPLGDVVLVHGGGGWGSVHTWDGDVFELTMRGRETAAAMGCHHLGDLNGPRERK
jgi:hypothetical protein